MIIEFLFPIFDLLAGPTQLYKLPYILNFTNDPESFYARDEAVSTGSKHPYIPGAGVNLPYNHAKSSRL